MSDMNYQNPSSKGLFSRRTSRFEKSNQQPDIDLMKPYGHEHNSIDSYSELGSLKNRFQPKTSNKKNFQEHINSFPAGKVFKNGANILKPAKAYDVYKPKAIHFDQTDNSNGNVREINGRLYSDNITGMVEYDPTEQIVQPNSHITGVAKNIEADRRLAEISEKPQNMLNNDIVSNIAMSSIGGAAIGSLMGSSLLMFGSLGIGGLAVYAISEQNKNTSNHPEEAQDGASSFGKRMSSLI
ncbi:MAG: hypothetical protein ACJARD_000218 [Alphaproteobacteria bacterium]|jgi:hypothetical protein